MAKLPTNLFLERMKARIQPELFVSQYKQMQTDLETRAATLIANLELNEASPHVPEMEQEMVREQIERALADINWRLDEIDAALKEFDEDREAAKTLNRATSRRQKAKAKKGGATPEETA